MANVGPFSMVLLFEDQANSMQIVQSLREKGLDVHTVNNASELIQMIAGHKFDLVCLSVNHSSATSLVQVLKIKTQVEVLVFGEDAELATTKAIIKSGADYQVTGIISSYNLWLKMGHLVREKQRHTEAATRILSGRHRADSDDEAMVIKSTPKKEQDDEKIAVVKSTIKPKKIAASDDMSLVTDLQKPGPPKKEKKLLMGAKKKPAKIIQTEEREEPAELIVATEPDEPTIIKSSPARKSPLLKVGSTSTSKSVSTARTQADPEPSQEDDESTIVVKEKRVAQKGKLMKMGKSANKAKSDGKAVVQEKQKENAKATVTIKAGKPIENLGAIEHLTEDQLIDREIDQIQNMFFEGNPEDMMSEAPLKIQDLPDAPTGKVTLSEKIDDDGNIKIKGDVQVRVTEEVLGDVSSYETEEDKIVSIEAARAHRKKQREKKMQAQAVKKPEKPQQATIQNIDKLRFKKVFREAVAKAGEAGFQKSEHTKTIGAVTKVSLIPVDNMSEKGFIVMANNKNDFSTADEVSGFKNSLMKEMGGFEDHAFALGDTYNIDTFEVDVTAWAEKSSQFFYMYEDADTGKQMLICFLRKEDLFPEAYKMEEHKMYRIELHVLPPKTPVNFDAYLFLARNEKMLPYLRRGGSITGKQVQRLYQRGFKFLYIKDEEIRDYYSFYFSLYLNQDFRTERKFA